MSASEMARCGAVVDKAPIVSLVFRSRTSHRLWSSESLVDERDQLLDRRVGDRRAIRVAVAGDDPRDGMPAGSVIQDDGFLAGALRPAEDIADLEADAIAGAG